MNSHSFSSEKAQKLIIYWDYENCPIPNKASSFGTVYNAIKRRIFSYLQYEVQVEAKVYIAAHKLPYKIKQGMEVCGAKNIDVPSLKPEAVDKRMLVDLALDLCDWIRNRNCHIIALISGDKDFGNILSRIHNTPEIAKLILIRLPRDDGTELPVNKNLYSSVDYVIDRNHGNGFAVTEFIDCPYGINCTRAKWGCTFYHHDMAYNNHLNQNSPSLTVSNISMSMSPYQSPASSISNTTVSSNECKSDHQMDAVMNQQTLEIRSKIKCRHGNKCTNWQNGNCHYFHPKPYAVYNRTKSTNNGCIRPPPRNKGNNSKCHWYDGTPYSVQSNQRGQAEKEENIYVTQTVSMADIRKEMEDITINSW